MTAPDAAEILKKIKQEDKERLEKAKDRRAIIIQLAREMKRKKEAPK